jgi:hypothetical protein
MAQGFALIMTWPIVSPPFLAGLLAARNTRWPFFAQLVSWDCKPNGY